MIKPSELRIGNIVSSILHKGLETEICGLSGSGVWLGANPMCCYKPEEIEPIPLTEEWLLKAGFEYDEEATEWNDEKCFSKGNISISVSGWLYNGIFTQKSDFIHQLQNIYYALKSEELTFSLLEDKEA